jgi:hypothetical protein
MQNEMDRLSDQLKASILQANNLKSELHALIGFVKQTSKDRVEIESHHSFMYENKTKFKNGLLCKPPIDGLGRRE